MQTTKTEQDTQRDRLELQTTAQEKENSKVSSELIEREEVEGTPFQLVNVGKGWFLALGRHRLTEMGEESKEELIAKVVNKDWYLVLDTIVALTMAIGQDDMTK